MRIKVTDNDLSPDTELCFSSKQDCIEHLQDMLDSYQVGDFTIKWSIPDSKG